MRRLATALLPLLGAACGSSASTAVVSLEGPIVARAQGSATGRVALHLDGAVAVATSGTLIVESARLGPASVSAADPASQWSADPAFTLDRVSATVQTHDGRAFLRGLTVPLGDLSVFAPATAPDVLRLTGLALTMPDTRLEIARASTDALTLTAPAATVQLAWQLVLDDGTRWPLGAIDVGPLDLHVGVWRDATTGEVQMVIGALCERTCGTNPELPLGAASLSLSAPLALD